jgi:thymidine kinase
MKRIILILIIMFYGANLQAQTYSGDKPFSNPSFMYGTNIGQYFQTLYRLGKYDDMLTTHDKIKIPCVKTNKLMDLDVDIHDVILVNEGQFFPDLYEFVDTILQLYQGKKIYVCGLDGDFERKKFGQILDLIPLCDKVTKLTSLCSICKDGTPGIFSKRISGETEQMVVGFDNYIPVCRRCYGN